jgi:hypothetical protein
MTHWLLNNYGPELLAAGTLALALGVAWHFGRRRPKLGDLDPMSAQWRQAKDLHRDS